MSEYGKKYNDMKNWSPDSLTTAMAYPTSGSLLPEAVEDIPS